MKIKYIFALLSSISFFLSASARNPDDEPVRFLVYTDLHVDLVPGGAGRLAEIMDKADSAEVDFIICLGDFAHPVKENRFLMDMIAANGRPHYHVPGNHDMDRADKETFCAFTGLEACHYYFEREPFRFIVLDTNSYFDQNGEVKHYAAGNYFRDAVQRDYIPDGQLQWLESLLADKGKIHVIFSHAPINRKFTDPGENRRVHDVIRDAAGSGSRVAMVAGGHNHSDNFHIIDGLPYWQVNSASYLWGGAGFADRSFFDSQLLQKYPSLASVAMYDKTLYALVTISPGGDVRIEGVQGNYSDPQPDAAKLAEKRYPCSPSIVDRTYNFIP